MDYNQVRDFDKHVNQLHRRRHSVPADGNCFYNAVAHQLSLLDENLTSNEIRRKCVNFLRRNKVVGDINWIKAVETSESSDQYLQRHLRDGEWCDQVMMQATASSLRFAIYIVSTEKVVKVEPSEQSYGDIWIGRPSESYFVSLLRDKKKDLGKKFQVDEIFHLAEMTRKPGILKQNGNGASPHHSSTPPAYTNPTAGKSDMYLNFNGDVNRILFIFIFEHIAPCTIIFTNYHQFTGTCWN